MNIKELWVGENVKIISSSRIGRFEGIAGDGRARVSSKGKMYLIKDTNLRIYEVPKVDKVKEMMQEMNQRPETTKMLSVDKTIDLHIKTLDPSLVNGLPEHILNHQLSACKSFLSKAITGRLWIVTIIHGKGAGVLRSEVLGLLKDYDEVERIESIKDDGAQRVYFKY